MNRCLQINSEFVQQEDNGSVKAFPPVGGALVGITSGERLFTALLGGDNFHLACDWLSDDSNWLRVLFGYVRKLKYQLNC